MPRAQANSHVRPRATRIASLQGLGRWLSPCGGRALSHLAPRAPATPALPRLAAPPDQGGRRSGERAMQRLGCNGTAGPLSAGLSENAHAHALRGRGSGSSPRHANGRDHVTHSCRHHHRARTHARRAACGPTGMRSSESSGSSRPCGNLFNNNNNVLV